MSPEEMLQVVPLTHIVWATADPELLEHIDVKHADGLMREWVKVTHYVLKGLKHFRTDTVDRQVADGPWPSADGCPPGRPRVFVRPRAECR
ncbi:hypothetical protein ACFRCI_34690 [Streptomyces sp. NPDC056638]|uniref:hypothetical protein n=1 Tax=Streptomyces sp. NPDC056638 TaxID=3345887 RepID=UPI0036750EBC